MIPIGRAHISARSVSSATNAFARRALDASVNTPGDSLDEHERAALHYLVWPVALVDAFRSDNSTLWSRLLFGFLVTAGYFVLLAVPFFIAVSFSALLATSGTILLYGCCFILDIAVALILMIGTIRYSLRARRGDLFTIPLVSAMSDRLFARSREGRDDRG